MQLASSIRTWIVLLIIIGLFSGCSGRKKWEDVQADVAWAKIQKYYKKKRYLDAIDHLEIFLINHSGAPMMDSAQFYIAECHYNLKEYIISASEYEKLYMQFPQSPLAEQAEYKLGMSYYELSPKYSLDQRFTEQAISAFQLYIEDFPETDGVKDAVEMIDVCRNKIARKAYENGRLYQKVKEFHAAGIYFNNVLDNFYDTIYAPMSLYQRAEMHVANDEYSEAIEDYSVFLDKYGEHDWSVKALKALNRAREKAKKTKVEE
ncbi:MAG: outer membrane protein assembly factor BamD [Candidatus Electryonea clarkiae]|nr:outer membrane protein assembly factor BamD [Candidatus Electryonea clarkiae]MDP8286278.1 outer membrane protein assembly factor BamD [Candidatus Electryonea clarkiae]